MDGSSHFLEPTVRPGPTAPTVLLLSRDLIFTTKVTGTARDLGCQVLVAGNRDLALSWIEQGSPATVLVDLSAGDLGSPDALAAYRKLAGATVRFVAFGAHVDVEALAAAKQAGCDEVMPRSKFTAELPRLIKESLNQNRAQ